MPTNLLIKPVSGQCNLRCGYCFYRDETKNRAVCSYGQMSEQTLENVLRKTLAQADAACTIGFQGGEPTLAGLEFFERAVELERRYNTRKIPVHYTLQTNATLLDKRWADFLQVHHFLVGVSLDGHSSLHDLHRRDAAGQGSFEQVMRGISLLRAAGVETNILTVVTAQTARNYRQLYHFFMRNELVYQQYIPCLDPLGQARGERAYSITPALYFRFLRGLFDLWLKDRRAGKFVYIRYFENLMCLMTGQGPESCGMTGRCGIQYAVEADGSVYPCDFYMLDSWRLGNFNTDSFADLDARRTALGFVEQSAQPHADCLGCRWYLLCRGGCRRDREPCAPGGPEKNVYCQAYQAFFAYAVPQLEAFLEGKHP